jgi:hypothetical protein
MSTPDGKSPAVQGGPDDIQTAWKLLAGGAPTAASALVHIAENGKSELARVQAAAAILDRVGLATPKERPSVTFAVIPKEFDHVGIGAQQLDPAEVVRSRLKELAQLTPPPSPFPQAQPAPWDSTEPVDAELVPMPGDTDDDGDWEPSGNPWG